MWRSWSESWRFLAEPWRYMAESCLRKCNRVRKKQCQEIMKIHETIRPKTQKSIKMSKNELRQSQDRFWAHFGCFLGAWGSLKWGKVGSGRGSKKTSIFKSPFFPTLANFRRSGGSFNSLDLAPFPLHFRSWGLLFLLGGHFCSFWWICVFWDLFFDECTWFLDIGFCERGCIFWGKILPWIAEVLAETAKILIIFFTYTCLLYTSPSPRD